MYSERTLLMGAVDALRARFGDAPGTAIQLGSGFSVLAEEVEGGDALPYAWIPAFPRCTNRAHPGCLVVGRFEGRRVVLMVGRLHQYEGYSATQVAFPIRALAEWGVKTFILTNAAGAIREDFQVGQFMAIVDHLSLTGQNPLVGLGEHEEFERFPDMSGAYRADLIDAALAEAVRAGFTLHTGVYAQMPGPSYETPAEIRMLRKLGADAVGMSTVPEAITAAHRRCRVFGLSCLTNPAAGIGSAPILDDEIKEILDHPARRRALRVILSGVLNAVER